MRAPRLCVIGDALLDIDWEGHVRRVCRDAPAPVVDAPTERVRPGGAALAATLAARAGARVTLVTALSGDDDGIGNHDARRQGLYSTASDLVVQTLTGTTGRL